VHERRQPLPVTAGIELEHEGSVRARLGHLVERRPREDPDARHGAAQLRGTRHRGRALVVEQRDRPDRRQHHRQRQADPEEGRRRGRVVDVAQDAPPQRDALQRDAVGPQRLLAVAPTGRVVPQLRLERAARRVDDLADGQEFGAVAAAAAVAQ
jgi:hypothetical protein